VPGGDGFRKATSRALVSQESFEDVDCGRERRTDGTILCLAVPATVLQLLTHEAINDGVDIEAEVDTQRNCPAIYARLYLASEEPLSCVFPAAMFFDHRQGKTYTVRLGIDSEFTQ
jgi:hypothetical protein